MRKPYCFAFLLPFIVGLTTGMLAPSALAAQSLTFFESFTDHAVLQRDVAHPLWGWGKPNKNVLIYFQGEEMKAEADNQGRWKVMLPATPAGGPYTIAAQSGRQRVTLKDVYFGDVYLLSGQSNMEWRLAQSDPNGARAAAIGDPLIRELKVSHAHQGEPQPHLPLDLRYGPTWLVGDSTKIGDFSGVGAYFAHHLRQAVDIPIGLIHSSWGGSRIEPWMNSEALTKAGVAVPPQDEAAREAAGEIGRQAFYKNFPGRDLPTVDNGEAKGWLKDAFDDAAWPTMTLPTQWEAAGYPSVDGHFYFRGSFTLTADQVAAGVTLHLGAIDDGDWTYVNGKMVGSHPNDYAADRIYEVEPSVLRAGRNTLAFRIFDGQGGGGFSASPEAFYLTSNGEKQSLAGDYRYNIGEFRVDAKPNQVPTLLYNAMIAPLRGMPLSGVLWYQGESNAGEGDNLKYADLMKGLIRQWRGEFSHGDVLPFYWVQLANYKALTSSPNEPGWATLRQSQTEALSEPVTGMAVITDIGEADDIHPKNKWEVGRRLSLFALRDIYGKPVVADSPVAVAANAINGKPKVTITFKDNARALTVNTASGSKDLLGFTAEDANGTWHFAKAKLTPENTVVVSISGSVPIKRVRYNWADNPNGNLYSQDGLPANAFELKVQ